MKKELYEKAVELDRKLQNFLRRKYLLKQLCDNWKNDKFNNYPVLNTINFSTSHINISDLFTQEELKKLIESKLDDKIRELQREFEEL